MWHGNSIAVRLFSLTLSIGSIPGCDVEPPPQVAKTASDPRRDLVPELRYQVDPLRRRVWILNRDGVFVYDVGTPEKTVVRLPDWLWVGGDYSCLPDLALGPKGEAVITSNIQPTLWRVDPDRLTVSVHPLVLDADADKDVGFTGLVYSAGHKAYFAVSDLHGSLWKVDSQLARAEKISLSAPVPKACGLTEQLRVVQRKAVRSVGLCARAQHGDSAIELSPDQRSGYVSTGVCVDRLAQMDALSRNGE